jgi:hypothetical protein
MIRPPYRRVRVQLLVAAALGGAALLAPTGPASADEPVADLDCTINVSIDVYPGVTPEPRHVALTTHGLTGTADCTGTIDGQAVTGPGSFAEMNQLVANCVHSTGQGEFVLRIPTTGGTKTVAGQFDVDTLALTGDLTGTVDVTSLEGDCITTPTTNATAVLTVHVT